MALPTIPGSYPANQIDTAINDTRGYIEDGPGSWDGAPAVTIAQGGTGATTKAAAKTALEVPTVAPVDTAQAGAVPIYNGAGQLTAVAPSLGAHVATKAYADSVGGQLTDGGTFLKANGKNLGTSGDLFADGTAYLYGTALAVVSYQAMYIETTTGRVGRNPSSRRYKKDITDAPLDLDALRQIVVKQFRYRADLFDKDDPTRQDIPLEVGLMAEDLDELGLTWLVVYDEQGRPDGVHYERLALALLPRLVDIEERLARLEGA